MEASLGTSSSMEHRTCSIFEEEFISVAGTCGTLPTIVRLQVADVRLQWALLPQHHADKSRTTDAWNAGPSTTGQRALRVTGAEDWAPIYASSQTIAASSSQTLKKVPVTFLSRNSG